MFGIMAFSWGLFLLVPILLVAYFPFAVINLWGKQGKKVTLDFVKLFLISFGVFFVLSIAAVGTGWISIAVNYVVGVIPADIPLVVIGVAVLFIIWCNEIPLKSIPSLA